VIATEPDFFANVGGTLVARYPNSPGFKREGTSSHAAKETQPHATTLRDSVLAALRQRPSTADEVAAAIGKTVLATRPRLSELRALGKIVETRDRRRNASGKMASVWRAT
jgi:predicted Rossmann fold nucleotide-binding protein DprA/Smf involved in DNA uptake